MRKGIAIVGALVLFLAAAGTSHAVLLSDLLNGGSVTAGDKLFDQWQVIFYDSSDPTRGFNAGNIDVTALNDGGLNPGPGLRFSVNNGELTMTGTGFYDYIDLQFGFRVSVLDPQMRISDSSISNPAAFWGIADVNQDWDLGWFLRESIGTALVLDDLASMEVQMNTLGPPQEINEVLSASTTFASSQSEIWVTKNILVWASFGNGSAGIFGFDERFSQTPVGVPEPGMLALLALGGMALLRFKRS